MWYCTVPNFRQETTTLSVQQQDQDRTRTTKGARPDSQNVQLDGNCNIDLSADLSSERGCKRARVTIVQYAPRLRNDEFFWSRETLVANLHAISSCTVRRCMSACAMATTNNKINSSMSSSVRYCGWFCALFAAVTGPPIDIT